MEVSQNQYILYLENLTEAFTNQYYKGLKRLEATDEPRSYWLLACRSGTDKKKTLWKKLLLQNARSIQPTLLELDSPLLLYLGVDEVIFILDSPTGELLARYDLGTPFLWFHSSENQIFAVCELEIYAFTLHGGLKWTTNFPDVLKNVVKKNEHLEVTDLSDRIYRVDVLTGKTLMRASQAVSSSP